MQRDFHHGLLGRCDTIRRVPRHLLWITAICALTLFAGLGRSAITDSDEAFYAESAREMRETGDWLTPMYNEEPRFEKPVLMYWLIAASYLVDGPSELAARLPSALAGLALAWLSYAIGRRWYDSTTGVLAGAIVATTYGCFAMARQALPDLLLTVWVVLSTWALIRALSPGNGPGEPAVDTASYQRRWLIIGATAAGMACLTKGPVGAVLPAIVAAPLALWEHRTQAGRWRWPPVLSRPAVLAAIGVFTLITAPWFLAMAERHGSEYLARFFVGENLLRFTTTEFNESRPTWFYLPILAGGFLPWTPFIALWIPSVVRTLRTRRAPTAASLRLTVWALAPLIFYTLSIGKQPRYILPMLPPIAILLASTLRWHAEAPRTRRRMGLFDGCAIAVAALWGLLAGLLFRARPLLEASGFPLPFLAPATLLCAAAVLLAVLARGTRRLVLPTVTVGGAITLLALHYQVLAPPRPAPVQTMAAAIVDLWEPGDTLGAYRAFGKNQIFYSGTPRHDLVSLEQTALFLDAPTRVLCLIPSRDLAGIHERVAAPIRVLAEVTYVNMAGLRLRDLWQPDPAMVQGGVQLVTNR